MKQFPFLIFCFAFHFAYAQVQTVGLLTYDPSQTEEGYTLIFPRNQATVFLIDNCGEIVHSWEDEDIFVPNNSVYLLENGDLVKCKKRKGHGPIGSGEGDFYVEIRTWNNELKWSYELNTVTERLHHDVEVLANGNILMIAWEYKSREEAELNGRIEDSFSQLYLYPDYIFEINPQTDEKVWEWHVWDHLIQDVDSTKLNYGVLADHPELININYGDNNTSIDWDWLHINAVDYNPKLDHIMLSVPYFDEMWIIDHSTTTEEARGHTGGNSGKGGDLLYRIGNPHAYGQGTKEDQTLFFPHDTHWVNDFIDASHPDYNKILIFNNQVDDIYSKMEKFDNPWDSIKNEYPIIDQVYQPKQFKNSITHPDSLSFFSMGLSSVQTLPNQNTLACSGGHGHIIELNPEGELVWEYKVPYKNEKIVAQGTVLQRWDNLTFRAFKYPPNYVAFDGRDLTPRGPIETEVQEDYCDRVVSTEEQNKSTNKIFPNPTNALVYLESENTVMTNVELINVLGIRIKHFKNLYSGSSIDLSDLETGMYFLIIDKSIPIPLMKL